MLKLEAQAGWRGYAGSSTGCRVERAVVAQSLALVHKSWLYIGGYIGGYVGRYIGGVPEAVSVGRLCGRAVQLVRRRRPRSRGSVLYAPSVGRSIPRQATSHVVHRVEYVHPMGPVACTQRQHVRCMWQGRRSLQMRRLPFCQILRHRVPESALARAPAGLYKGLCGLHRLT